ncbi:hypothetical protein V5O48_019591, partial [Marasmius crinis-equi]
GSFYDFQPGVKDLKVIVNEVESQAPPATPQWSFEEQMAMRADGNTHWDADSEFPLPFGYFDNMGSSTPIPDSPDSPPPQMPESSLDQSERAQADALAAFVLEAQREAEEEEAAAALARPRLSPTPPRHWIVHPRLVGLSIQANVTSKGIKYLDIVATPTGSIVPRMKDGPVIVTVHDL